MFTKKHYDKLSKGIRNVKLAAFEQPHLYAWRDIEHAIKTEIEDPWTVIFKESNKRFNVEMFQDACKI